MGLYLPGILCFPSFERSPYHILTSQVFETISFILFRSVDERTSSMESNFFALP
jgi:hypothetical protein